MYLKSVQISNFRIFPPSFSLELNGPGVTILAGQNGLGKSSFFEAIEWALTGKVERIHTLPTSDVADAKHRELVYAWISEGKISDYIDVALEFDDSGEIHRIRRKWDYLKAKRAFNRALEPTPAEVAHLLQNPRWSLDITDISSYLLQTHILTQSEQLRFLARDPKNRWSGLVGPIGFERLSRAQRSLTVGTTRALTQKFNERENRVRQTEKEIESWTAIIKELHEHRIRATAVVGLNPQMLEIQLSDITSELIALLSRCGYQWVPPQRPSISMQPIEEGFTVLESALTQRLRLLEQARIVPSAIANISLELSAKQESLKSAEVAHEQATLLHTSLKSQLSELQNSLLIIRTQISDAQTRWTLISRVAEALGEVEELERRYAQECGRHSTLRDQLKQASEEHQRACNSQREVNAKSANYRDLSQRVAQLREARGRSIEVDIELSKIQALRSKIEELNTLAANLDEKLTGVAEQISSYYEQKRLLDIERGNLRDKTGSLSRAIAEIAALVDAHSTACPVCGSHFSETGDLLQRIRERAQDEDPNLASVESKLSEVTSIIANLREQQNSLQRERAVISANADATISAITAAEEAQAELRQLPALADMNTIELTASIDRAILELVALLQQGESDSNELALAEQRVNATRMTVQQLEVEVAGASESCDRLSMRLSLHQQVLRDNEVIATEIAAGRERGLRAEVTQTSQRAQQEEQSTLSTITRLLADIRTAEERSNDARTRLETIRNMVEDATTSAAQQENGLRAIWDSAGCGNAITTDALFATEQVVSTIVTDVNDLRQRRERLREQLGLWQQHERQNDIAARVTAKITELGETTEDGVSKQLEARLIEEQRLLNKVKRAKDLVAQTADLLRDATQNYISETLDPINRLSDLYHHAFSTFPERKVTMSPRTDNKQGTSLRANVRLHRNSTDTPDDELPARHILSEGQLAETSLSLLFAMSTGCRWSRWRALLLDDPLQHNDIVHAAAFIDVVRNMAADAEQPYQFVISTHDLDLAEYFRRKLAAGKVPCTLYRYVRPGVVERQE